MIRLIFLMEFLFAIYGVYSEISNNLGDKLPFTYLPSGMGLAVALISVGMIFALKEIKEIMIESNKSVYIDALNKVVSLSGLSMPVHEREFYALWTEQIKNATNNIDVTHLGIKPPSMTHESEENYFEKMRDIYSKSKAKIRRVERGSIDKKPWIKRIVSTMKGVQNFSLSILIDPSEEEMPYSLSVSRIDNSFAWIVAMAEHESTSNFRDLMITGERSVELFSKYFEERLWKRSILIMQNGKEIKDWERKIYPSDRK